MPSAKPLVTIPDPTTDPLSLRATVLAIKELVEVLGGQRGTSDMRAVNWADLKRLGLATDSEQPTRPPGTIVGPGGFTTFTYTLDSTLTAPPDTGQARFDDIDMTDATKLWLSGFNSAGVNNINFFRVATINRILVQEAADATRYNVYDAPGAQSVLGQVSADYVEIPIVWASSGPDQPRAGQPIIVAMA